MEKYLVIILVILLMYTVYQCWNFATVTTEGFADATVPTNVDTNNSIKTLAQLATDLQSGGGLKVPGVQSLANGVWHTSLDGKNRVHYGANATTYFGSQDGYIWRNKGDGDIMKLGDNGIQSLANGVWHTSLDGKNRVYYDANATTYFGSQGGYKWRNKSDNVDIMTLGDNGDLIANNGITTNRLKIGNAILEWKNDRLEISGAPVAIINNTLIVTQPGINHRYITIQSPGGESTLALDSNNHPYFINGASSTNHGGQSVAQW